MNEPGGNIKRAEDDHRPTTTIIQIPQGAASTLSSSKILECINAAKKDANSAVTMVTEGKDDAKTTVKVTMVECQGSCVQGKGVGLGSAPSLL